MEPVAPTTPDGATASLAQMNAGRLAARDFIAQSDVYQDCLTNELSAVSLPDAKAQMRMEKAAGAKIAANQRRKESVGAAINDAIARYEQTHP